MEEKILHQPTQSDRLGQFAVSHFVISVLAALLAIAVGFLLLVLAARIGEVFMYIILLTCSVAGLFAYAAAGVYSAQTYHWNVPKNFRDGFLAFLFPALIAWAWGSLMLYCASLSGKEAWDLVSVLLPVNFFVALPSLVMVVTSFVLGFLDGELLNLVVCMLLVGGMPPLLFLLGSIWGSKKEERSATNSDKEQEEFDGT